MIRRLLILAIFLPALANAEPFLVENGQSRAEIIIADEPTRTTRLAAQELQTYIEKISGASLTIGAKQNANFPIKIYVGQSSHTEKLGVTTEGLQDGAYRIVSGEKWIVFIGDDTNFTPIEPWPRSNADIASGKMQEAWNQITGKNWGYTHGQLHKHYSGRNSLFGTPDEEIFDAEGNVNVWTYDERGSFNAVCGFLRDLGVRWYLPGEIGEIVPETASIPLPQVDKTVRPDFPMRILNFRAAVYGRDAMMWGFRLGVRQPFGRQAAHGLARMTDNEPTLKNHPDWFALYGGKRHNQTNVKCNQLCYSNEELFQESVQFARAQLDHFDMDVVSIMPPDGYTAICQCSLCEGKESPELGARGALSNYVWDFVNRVAKEVGKTHPDKRISNCAYGIYTEAPDNIEKLEPNVQVIIVGGRRPMQEDRADLRRLRANWEKLTDNPIEIFENYPFTGRGWYLPAYNPRVMGESINETKDQSRGEDIWITMDFSDKAIGFNHYLLYFTARMYWGGKEKDSLAMFDEYVEKFYGPVASEMRAFFAFCEENWRAMEFDGEIAAQALDLFAVAKEKTPADSVYAGRVGLIDNFLNSLRVKATQLSQERGPVPTLRLVSGATQCGEITIDGKLEDGPWVNIPGSSKGGLRELQTGRQPIYGTEIKAEWIGNDLYFAIRCEEALGEAINIGTRKDGDSAIWYGDCLEFLLATNAHSYYQIAISPSGAVVDYDRGAPRQQWDSWSSKVEVATQIVDDHWTAEIRLSIVQDENDPLHQVIGRKPTQSLPWFVNICRQRIRDDGSEFSAFSPTGTKGFHEPMKFAHFFGGNSHRFDADPTVSDYLIDSRAAEMLLRARKFEEAMTAYAAMADGKKVTDFQKSDALQFAASCARSLKDLEKADQFAEQIPLDAVAKTVRMDNLLAQRDWASLIEQFGSEDFSQWPFWQRGAGAFARAKAHVFEKNGEKAEDDFKTALAFTSDSRTRTSILAMMGNNRETNLKDDIAAFDAYRQNYESRQRIGGADEYRSVISAAGIQARQGKLDDALATLDRINVENQKGYWRHATLLALGETLTAAGKKEDARKTYQDLAADNTASESHRESAEEALKGLGNGQ